MLTIKVRIPNLTPVLRRLPTVVSICVSSSPAAERPKTQSHAERWNEVKTKRGNENNAEHENKETTPTSSTIDIIPIVR